MRQGGMPPVPGLDSFVRRCGHIGPTSRACDKNRARRVRGQKPHRNGARPSSEHVTWKLSSTWRTMSSGRSERRIAKAVSVEVCAQDEPKLNEIVWTENVSAHGARILTEEKLRPGQQVLVRAPKE